MLSLIYKKFLARDKILRHTFQHFEVALIGIFIYSLIIQKLPNLASLFLFFIFTYLPDLDGILSVFVWQKKNPTANKIVSLIFQKGINDAFLYATINHKNLNRLILHNFISYAFLIIFLINSISKNHYFTGLMLSSVITHLTFDICDDIFQLGNVKNWLWPLHIIFQNTHWFDTNKKSFPIPKLYKKVTIEPLDYLFKKTKKR